MAKMTKIVSLLILFTLSFNLRVNAHELNQFFVGRPQFYTDPNYSQMLQGYLRERMEFLGVVLENKVNTQDTCPITEKWISKIYKRLLVSSKLETLLEKWPLDIVVICKSKTINAIYGQGIITIYSGLVVHANSEEEIAFVLAHELAHHLRDHDDRVRSQNINVLEDEADIYGLEILSKAGYSSQDALAGLKNFLSSASIEDQENHWNHSSLSKRLENLQAEIDFHNYPNFKIRDLKELEASKKELIFSK